MQTITFYSYKGGVGRTLFVANVAKFLSKLRQKVFIVDFDLEAPGLHYKFNLDETGSGERIEKGVLDYIHSFSTGQGIPEKLEEYVVQVTNSDDKSGPINLMAAGNAPSIDYWRKLAQINWHELFYAEGAKGIPFFLELKEQIDKQYKPDFLLIDSRTGITEVGGVATGILSDKLVCLLIMNRENLEGARAVLRSVKRAPRLPGQSPVELLPVLTRIPLSSKSPHDENLLTEEALVDKVRTFLNEEAPHLSNTLDIPRIFILHSEPELQVSESLRIGSGKSLSESPLLRDYVLLLAQLISRESIEPHIGTLLQEAMEKSEHDLAGARVMLESLTAYCPHPATYRALLKFYKLQNVDTEELLETAVQFWKVTGTYKDSLLQELVKENFTWDRFPYSIPPLTMLEFGEAIWRAAGDADIKTGLFLAQGYRRIHRQIHGVEILRALVSHGEGNEEVVIEYVEQLRELQRWKDALDLVKQTRQALANSNKFLATWASLIVDTGDSLEAEFFLSEVPISDFSVITPLIAAKLLLLVNSRDDVSGLLQKAFGEALQSGTPSSLVKVGETFKEVGRRGQFEELIRKHFDAEEADSLIHRIFHRWRLPGMPNL